MSTYKQLYDEDIKMTEMKRKIEDKKYKVKNKEYEKIKNFIKNTPVEFYLNKK